MAILYLPLKREYFEQILAGVKPLEFRLRNAHWTKRLEGKSYDGIVLTLGYPAVDDQSKRLYRQWKGYELQTIQHPHFGKDPVDVFAIDVTQPWLNASSGL